MAVTSSGRKSNETKSYFRTLGILGLDDIEDFVLAGAVKGDPIAFIGDPGTAKSSFVKAFAGALGYRANDYREIAFDADGKMAVDGKPIQTIVDKEKWKQVASYSAPTICFEDFLGLPYPDEANGTLTYLQTPVSVWNKKVLLIDEINRSSIDIQNKLLTLISEREIMGESVDVHFIFAAMNHLAEKGTSPLDRALSDRFCMVLPMPSWSNLSQADKLSIVSESREHNFSYLLDKKFDHQRDDALLNCLSRARDIYNNVDCKIAEFMIGVADDIMRKATSPKEVDGFEKINTRRVRLMATNLKALFAVKIAKYGENGVNYKNTKLLADLITFSLPQAMYSTLNLRSEIVEGIVKNHYNTLQPYTSNSKLAFVLSLNDGTSMMNSGLLEKDVVTDQSALSQVANSAFNLLEETSRKSKSTVLTSSEMMGMVHFVLINKHLFDKSVLGRALDEFGQLKRLIGATLLNYPTGSKPSSDAFKFFNVTFSHLKTGKGWSLLEKDINTLGDELMESEALKSNIMRVGRIEFYTFIQDMIWTDKSVFDNKSSQEVTSMKSAALILSQALSTAYNSHKFSGKTTKEIL